MGSPQIGVRFDFLKRVSLQLIKLVMVDVVDDQLSSYVVVSFVEVAR